MKTKVRIDKTMLETIIKRVIAEELIRTDMKDSDELDRSNEEDRERIEREMAADWAELDRINREFYAKHAQEVQEQKSRRGKKSFRKI